MFTSFKQNNIPQRSSNKRPENRNCSTISPYNFKSFLLSISHIQKVIKNKHYQHKVELTHILNSIISKIEAVNKTIGWVVGSDIRH